MLGRPFALDLPGTVGEVGEEVSPLTGDALGITYPKLDADEAYAAVTAAQRDWRRVPVPERAGVCLEMLDRLGSAESLFVNAHATVHTAGQSFIMAFAGWERRFGAGPETRLEKRYRIMPRGVGVVITCATFPQWNGYPAIMANLATGNGVIVKPHPRTTLPVALFVRTLREVLAETGHDPNLVIMAADTEVAPNTLEFIRHPDCAIIDFTGGPRFGGWIEKNCADRLVFTETAGCNSVVIESVDDFDAVRRAVAHSLCQASAQMCTSVQNIFVPRGGIEADGRHLSFHEVAAGIVDAVEEFLADPKQAGNLCGALVDPRILQQIDQIRDAVTERGTLLRDSAPYEHPDYPHARTATPLIGRVDAAADDLYGEEHFGPISFVIAVDDPDHALARATEDVRRHGAITSHVYSTNDEFLERAEDAYHEAGASLSCNLTGMPINFAAAYSDFHVTGLNPAGNACLADLDFVTGRFRWVQTRWPRRSDAA
ncbi:MAG: aldehyde dehydrogenase family protein [Gammaproteobacteria bacterium]